MNPHLSEAAVAFGEVAAKALDDAGGVDLARRAEADPELRRREIGPLLGRLGLDELDAAADPEQAEALAALCRDAGRVVLPYPVVAQSLSRPEAEPLALVGPRSRRVDHAEVVGAWRLATIDGSVGVGAPSGGRLATRLGPFVADVSVDSRDTSVLPVEIALHLTLTAFVVAGALSRALELAVDHVREREQFGRPLAAFQAVQFQLADAHVAVESVDVMSHFALWRCHDAPDEALSDALAARSAALDAAHLVLRTTQQLHGASGLCDEYDVSIIVRHLQPTLRLPFGSEATAVHLADAVDRFGFVGLFPHGAHST